jgi:hypothetical protein
MPRRTSDPLEEVERAMPLEEEAESHTMLAGLGLPQITAPVLVTAIVVAALLWYLAT